jgi:hypothetical protein
MNKLILLILIACGVSVTHAQHRKTPAPPAGVRIRKDVPTVYLAFERVGAVKSSASGEEEERVWLRLHNNTRWPVRLQMSGVPSDEYGDARLYYDGLSNGEVLFRIRCHACSVNLLSPGKSLLFSVPRGELGEGRAVRVGFSYGWEDGDDVAAGREPEHYVSFDASQIPAGGVRR